MSTTPYALHSAADLQAALLAQFPSAGGADFMNAAYCAATRGWVGGPFSKYFFDYLVARGDLKWKKRGNQCEHFALRAALEAVALFSHTEDPRIPAEAESLAVAACKYWRADGRGAHEVNLWCIDGAWLPWEPQTGAFFEFTPAEAGTVQRVIIP